MTSEIRQKIVIYLYFIEGLSVSDISKEFEISRTAVYNIIKVACQTGLQK